MCTENLISPQWNPQLNRYQQTTEEKELKLFNCQKKQSPYRWMRRNMQKKTIKNQIDFRIKKKMESDQSPTARSIKIQREKNMTYS